MFPAAWVLEVTGKDPAARWRGRYSDEAGAFAFIKAEGGIVRTMARAAASVGLKRTKRGHAGDVGVVQHLGVRGRAAGAICLGAGLWVSLADGGGLWMARPRCLAGWAVG